MNKRIIKKLVRTWMIRFPILQESKFTLVRLFRRMLRVPSEQDFLALNLLKNFDGALFLDVGANLGQTTDAILMSGRKVWIQLFEPNQLLATKLGKLFRGVERITIHSFGLGNTSSDATLYVPFYRDWMFSGHASFNAEEARTSLRDRIFSFDERLVRLCEVPSHTRRLDDLNLAPFFIKLDTQGYEYQALEGGEGTIKKHRPFLLIEAANRKIAEYLAGFGYRPFVFKAGKFHADRFGSPNTFFITADKLSLVPVTALAAGKPGQAVSTAVQQSRPGPKV